MTAYADTISRPVKTLTEAEQRALLKVTAQHVDGFRDHVIFSVAMGTGLREHELWRADVGDVFDDAGRAKRRVAPACSKFRGGPRRRRRCCSPTPCAPSSNGSSRRASARARPSRRPRRSS